MSAYYDAGECELHHVELIADADEDGRCDYCPACAAEDKGLVPTCVWGCDRKPGWDCDRCEACHPDDEREFDAPAEEPESHALAYAEMAFVVLALLGYLFLTLLA